ncbi:R3HC1 protein, partial [Chloropsis cyanopogon]|nr:R3HC1 protein [Chloropsis cyanopogon]
GRLPSLRSMDGVFLSPTEDEFVGRIAEELEHFMVQGQHHRVLLFPPLSSRLRYLIHRTVENMELLSSFSVGEGWRRRTVICHSAVSTPGASLGSGRGTEVSLEPLEHSQLSQPGSRGAAALHPGDIHGDNARASVGSGRITRPPRRKPDKALYVPKGIRKKANWRERESPGAEPDGDAAPGGENCPRNSIGDTQQELGKGGGSPGKQQEPEEEHVAGQGSAEHPLCEEKVPSLGHSSDSCEQESRDKDCSHSLSSGHSKHPSEAEEQEPSHANTIIPEGSEFQGQLQEENQSSRDFGGEEEEDKEHADVAEALWRGLDLAAGDREGTRQSGPEDDCTAELLAEIVGNLTVKDISIERISVDYSSYREAPVSEGDLGHVTEIYDFPSSLKTEDLMEMFSDFHESGFKIQWVDDTHALGIFSSLSTASQALGRRYPCLKIRPLIHATKQSKVKALQRPKLLHLGKERPQTDTAVARRLVSHALGWRQRQQEAAGNEVFQPESLEQEE